ncbi:MAG TPA: hypothetical protein VEI97_12370 [bacterium]|nr:hypothetical protein [bacterium]
MQLCVPLALAFAAILTLGCPKDSSANAGPQAKGPEPATKTASDPEEPPAGVPDDPAERNAAALANFQAIVAFVDQYQVENQEYPQSLDLHWQPGPSGEPTLDGKAYTNPFTDKPLREDHSFLGLDQGSFTYSAITLPDGSQSGYVFLGYGDNGGEPPSDELTETFFKARNFVEWNKGGTSPRLDNDIPEHTIFAVFKRGEKGEDPPADWEAPPQESLVSQQDESLPDS